MCNSELLAIDRKHIPRFDRYEGDAGELMMPALLFGTHHMLSVKVVLRTRVSNGTAYELEVLDGLGENRERIKRFSLFVPLDEIDAWAIVYWN